MYRRLLGKLGFGRKEVGLDGKAADAVLLLGYRFTGVSRNPLTVKAGRDQLIKELSHTFRKLQMIQENQENIVVGEPALPFSSCNSFVGGNVLPLKVLPGQTDVIHKLNSYLPPTIKAFDLVEVSPKFNIADWDRATCSCYVPTYALEPSVQGYEGYRLPGKILSKLEDTAKHVTSIKDLQMFGQNEGLNRNVATVNNISIPALFEKEGCEYLQLVIDFSGLGTQSVEQIVGTALTVTRSDFDMEEFLNIISTSQTKLPHFPRLILDKVNYDTYNSTVIQNVEYRQIGWLSSKADRELFKQEMFLPDMVTDDINSKMWWNEYLIIPAEVKIKEAVSVTKTGEIMETDKHVTGQTFDADIMLETEEITRSGNVEVIKTDKVREQGRAIFTEKGVTMIKDDTRANLDGEIRHESDRQMMNDVDMMNNETDEMSRHGGAIGTEMDDTIAMVRNDTRPNFDGEITSEREKMINDNVHTLNNETDEISKHDGASIRDIDDTMVMDKNEIKPNFDGEIISETEKMMNDNIDTKNNETDEISKHGGANMTDIDNTMVIDKNETKPIFDGESKLETEKMMTNDHVDMINNETDEIGKHGGAVVTEVSNAIVTDKYNTRQSFSGDSLMAEIDDLAHKVGTLTADKDDLTPTHDTIVTDNLFHSHDTIAEIDDSTHLTDTLKTEKGDFTHEVIKLMTEKEALDQKSESLKAEKDDTCNTSESQNEKQYVLNHTNKTNNTEMDDPDLTSKPVKGRKDHQTQTSKTVRAKVDHPNQTSKTVRTIKENLVTTSKTERAKEADLDHTSRTVKAKVGRTKQTGETESEKKVDSDHISKTLKAKKVELDHTSKSVKARKDDTIKLPVSRTSKAPQDDQDQTSKTVRAKKDNLVHTSKAEKAKEIDLDHTSKTVKAREGHPSQASETMKAKKDNLIHLSKTEKAKGVDLDHTSKTVKSKVDHPNQTSETLISKKDKLVHTSKPEKTKEVDLDHTSKTVKSKVDHQNQTSETVKSKRDNLVHTSKTEKAKKVDLDYTSKRVKAKIDHLDQTNETVRAKTVDTDHTSKTARAKMVDSSKLNKSPEAMVDYPEHTRKTLVARKDQNNTSKSAKERNEDINLTWETMKVENNKMDLTSDTMTAKKNDTDHISKSVNVKMVDTDQSGKTVSLSDRMFLSNLDNHCLIDHITVNKTDLLTNTDENSFSQLSETNQRKAPNRSEKDINNQRNDVFETKSDIRSEKFMVGMTGMENVGQNDENAEIKLPDVHVGSKPSNKPKDVTLVAIEELFYLLSSTLDDMHVYLSSTQTAFRFGEKQHRKLIKVEKNNITYSFPYDMETFWELDKTLSQIELVNGELQVICEEMEKVCSRKFFDAVVAGQEKKLQDRWTLLSQKLYRTQRRLKRSVEVTKELQSVQNKILDSIISQADTFRKVESTSNIIEASESEDSGVIFDQPMDSKQLPDKVILNKTKATGANYGRNKVAQSSTHRTLADKTSMKTQLSDLPEEKRVKHDDSVNSGTEKKDEGKKMPKLEDLW